MARRRPVHDKLVADALKRQRAAGAKLSRLRARGIDTSTIDPRQSAANVRAMTNAQLRQYHGKLDTFVRNRGYVAGAGGQPINRTAFEYLKRLERQNNKIVQGYEDRVGGLQVPTLGEQDIASQIARRDNERFRAGGEQATFQRYNQQADEIEGQAGVMGLIRRMLNKTSPGYKDQRLNTTRQNVEQMLETIGDDDMIARLSYINNDALNVMVDYSPFMASLSARYEYMKALAKDEEYKPESWMQDAYDSAFDDLKEFFTWGETLNESAADDAAPRRSPRRTRKRGK